jgi:hypothetical protein
MTRPAPRNLTVKTGEDRTVALDGRTLQPGCDPVQTQWSLYVQRRLECGDLIEIPPAAPTPAAPLAPAPVKPPAPPAAPASAPDASKGVSP